MDMIDDGERNETNEGVVQSFEVVGGQARDKERRA